jgi:hypothetical protein
MKFSAIVLILLLMSDVLFAQNDSTSQNNNTTENKNRLEKLYIYALQENVAAIIIKLDSISDDTLNNDELEFKQKYVKRFKKEDEIPQYKTTDTFLTGVIKLYQDYWKNILMKKFPVDTADAMLKTSLENYLSKYSPSGSDKKKISKDVFEYIVPLLNKRGFQVANGKTADIYDLLVWAKENKVDYVAELPETTTNVTVVFMDSIVTMGWEEYSTFGKFYPGGWATEKLLYSVSSAYDTTSEDFKISYLKHEGQHFADYKVYPHLSGADLEYRAKLVEFTYAKESLYKLITFFIQNSGLDRSNSHAFANYHVIHNLSEALFHKYTPDIDDWKKINPLEINAAAKILLLQNSADLNKVGKNVSEFIK